MAGSPMTHRVVAALTGVAILSTAAAAQSVRTEADVTVGATTENIQAAATQFRAFGDLPRGWRFYADATWATRRGRDSDVFGSAYPYGPELRPMEAFLEKTNVTGGRVLGVRLGRYRTPFGLYGRSDHGYSGFLRAPLVRYSHYWAVSNNYLDAGVSVLAGTTWLSGEASVAVASDEDEYARARGLSGSARVQAAAGPVIVGVSYLRAQPSETWGFATGHASFTGVDVRWMASGVQIRGEWLTGKPFAEASTRGGYVDVLVHRPFMGPLTAVGRVERLDYFAGPFSDFPRRYTAGGKVRLTRHLTGQLNWVRQPQGVAGHPGHTSLDLALTLTIRPGG